MTPPGTPTPDAQALLAVLEATWPAAAMIPCGPFWLRDGAGGGKRVSAATLREDATGFTPADLTRAEAMMRDAGGPCLFRLAVGTGDDATLDRALAARGYGVADPTLLMVAPATAAAPAHPVFALWPPLAVQAEIWEEDHITAPRRAVMARVQGPQTALLGRLGDQPGGAGFVAMGLGGRVAMLHALAVRPACRRAGLARAMMQRAQLWAAEMGAAWLALAVTEANAPARALYEGLGFRVAGQYHYRVAPDVSGPVSGDSSGGDGSRNP